MNNEVVLNHADYWEKDIDYVMFVDENNSVSSLNNVKKKLLNNETISPNENIFTVTGCYFNKAEYKIIKERLDNLRKKYWKDGKYNKSNNILEYVCFHTEDIKSRKKAFHKSLLPEEKYDEFISDLDKIIQESNYNIISINIKIDDFIKYSSYKELNIYNVAFNFIIERFIYNTPKTKKLAVIFEARGKKEDKALLKHINTIINVTGTEFIGIEELQKKIKGIYFNSKRGKSGYPYCGLEIADLSSYPIHRYVKFKTQGKDFKTIKHKVVGYPNAFGKGFKIYPKK